MATHNAEPDPDSDLEFDPHELGPRIEPADVLAHSGHARGLSSSAIPMRTLAQPPRHGRGHKSLDADAHTREPRGSLEQTDERDETSADGINVGDATPLLHADGETASGAASQNQKRRSRLRLSARAKSNDNLAQEDDLDDPRSNGKSTTRSITIGQYPPPRFPPNAISNAKYTPWSFLPRTLYNEFSFFINLYFLVIALSQLITPLRIGVLWTYMAPLAFVLAITLGKEALDDITRRRRDAEANRELYTMLRIRDAASSQAQRSKQSRKARSHARGQSSGGHHRLEAIEEEEEQTGSLVEIDEMRVKSKDIKVGDVLKLGKDDRVPADVVILKTVAADTAIVSVPAGPARRTGPPDLLFDAKADAKGDELPEKDTNPAQDAQSPPADGGSGSGEAFIRTDQLDGETDWKLRIAPPLTQPLALADFARLAIVAGKPSQKVNEFLGRVELRPKSAAFASATGSANVTASGSASAEATETLSDTTTQTSGLSIDNTAWANTVLASNATVFAVVVYTGAQTRQALSTAPSRSKIGLLEYEINNLTKILCLLTMTLSGVLVGLQAYSKNLDFPWYVSICRYLILFSSIIPISLRVNLDLGKSVYAWYIQHDPEMPEAVLRTSTIPEDLGRIEYLLTDKTGTLTQNEMDLRKIHVGTVSYANEAMEEVATYLRQGFGHGAADVMQISQLVTPSSLLLAGTGTGTGTRTRREIGTRVRDVVLALGLCHNVTPSIEHHDGHAVTTYQASSPDEIAIVQWTESVGLRLVHRDRQQIALQSSTTSRIVVRVRILDVFPFTSESKRMGIIVQFLEGPSNDPAACTPGEIWFYQKGADTVMSRIVAANDWLDEETANMAREGLRTLVVGRRRLSQPQYDVFTTAYREAAASLHGRDVQVANVVAAHLERDLELLGVTGVEDKLQADVRGSLELLRNAGVRIWMLTGDKVETARCVAVASKLVSRAQRIHTLTNLAAMVQSQPTAVSDAFALLAARPESTALLLDGDSLAYLLENHRTAFVELSVRLPAVIACRCSPTQKADVAKLIRAHTKRRVACIGDGGNDVSMIQAADVGVGIVGKEGRQASLAADVSITQFRHLTRLLVWHGRLSYKRSAKLAQFVIHRGLIVSVAQAVFSAAAKFEPQALFRDWLLVGYATAYTQLPLFSLVLDRDVDVGLALLYPELYKELTPGTSLSYRTFFAWLAVSVYQGLVIQILSQVFVGRTVASSSPSSSASSGSDGSTAGAVADPRLVTVAFTALILTELVMVGISVTTWHALMILAIAVTFVVYAGSVPLLGAYFDLDWLLSAPAQFTWRVAAVLAIAVIPVWLVAVVRRTVRPPSYRKVRGV